MWKRAAVSANATHGMIQPVLLAAGASRRFGGNKLLQRLPGGPPVVVAAARTLIGVFGQTVAVVREPDSGVARCLASESGIELLVCPEAAEGMGRSIARAVRARSRADAWLLALGDMPFINPQTLIGVVDLLEQGRPIVAPSYRGRRGHPVGFAREFRSELMALKGDVGARGVLARHRVRLSLYACDDPGVIRDVDRPEDLRPV